MKNIALEVEVGTKGWMFANLSDEDISLEIAGVIMNEEKGGTYSYPFSLDVEENAHIFGSAAELRGNDLFNLIHGSRCRLTVNNVPIVQGKIDLDESVDVKLGSNGHHTIEVKVVSRNKSYEEKIEGAKLRDLPIADEKIQIGYCLPEDLSFLAKFERTIYGMDKVSGPMEGAILINGEYWRTNAYESKEIVTKTCSISLPHYMFPVYTDTLYEGTYSGNFVNVSEPYDPTNPMAHPYCNTRICYQQYEKDSENEDTWNKVRGYSVGEPDRMNSAPCFYMGFVFDYAMKKMNIPVVSNALNNLMDYRRMAFWHPDARYDVASISNRGVGFTNDKEINNFEIDAYYSAGQQYHGNNLYRVKNNGKMYLYKYNFKGTSQGDLRAITPIFNVYRAYANADNLPDIEVKDLISNMTSAFGARVVYDEYMGSMKIVLLSDIMRDSANAIEVPGTMVSVTKTESNNRGFRLKYSGSTEQSANTITKVKNDSQGSDDTSYNYFGYKNVRYLQQGEEYTSYKDLVMGVSCNDMNLYIDKITGNMYRVKVDSDADNAGAWFPSVFEVGGYRDVEYGDCSDDDTTEVVTIPFGPAISSMINQTEMRLAQQNGEDIPNPIYAQYVDCEIHKTGELLEHKYSYAAIPLDVVQDTDGKLVHSCHVDVEVKVTAMEEWGSATDPPEYDKECENVLGIMRGSGSGEGVVYYEKNFDGEGTSKYMLTAGSDAEFFSDTCNHFGQMFDYNGGGDTEIDKAMAEIYLRSYFGGCGIDWTKYYSPNLSVKQVEDKWCIYNNDTKVGTYDSQTGANEYLQLLNSLRRFFFDAEWADPLQKHTVHIPDNGLGYLPTDAISLKLKAEKPVDGNEKSKQYYGVEEVLKRRGLFDKFYVDWADFWLHHKIANITYVMELSAFSQIEQDTTKWYKFGDFVGLIKNGTARVMNDGRVSMEVKLAYL